MTVNCIVRTDAEAGFFVEEPRPVLLLHMKKGDVALRECFRNQEFDQARVALAAKVRMGADCD